MFSYIATALPRCVFVTTNRYRLHGIMTLALLVRDSSAVWRLLWICRSRGTSESYSYGKQRICFSNSGSAHFHVSWLSDFVFYQKPLYKSLHQSFFYSFITILTLRKWCNTPLQHDFALDPMIPPFVFDVTYQLNKKYFVSGQTESKRSSATNM